MNSTLQFILAITCAVPAAAGIIFFRRIDKRYRPIIYILLLAVLTEALVEINKIYGKNNAATTGFILNMFILANTVLHLWLFFNAGVIKNIKNVFIYLVFFMMVYLSDAIYYQSFSKVHILAGIFSYVIILQLCMKGVALQTFKKYVWIKDGLFLYYAINIIYSAYFILLFSVRFIGLIKKNSVWYILVYQHDYINAVCYLLTLWAILCLPKKKSYIPSSI